MSLLKWLIGGGLAVGAAVLLGWKKFGDRLQVLPDVAIDAVGLTWIRFQVTPTIKNPSDKALIFTYPFVSLYHQGNLLGSSEVRSDIITVPKLDQVKIEPPDYAPIKIKVTMDRLGSLFPILTALLISGVKPKPGQALLKVVTETRLYPEGVNLAYKTEETHSFA